MFGFPDRNYGTSNHWKPRIYQNAEVSVSRDSTGLFRTDGEWCWVFGQVQFDAAGSAGNGIYVINPPLPVVPFKTPTTVTTWRHIALGSFKYRRAAADYNGTVYADLVIPPLLDSAIPFSFQHGNASSTNLGVSPSFAIASGDVLSFTLSFPFMYADRFPPQM